MLGKKDFGMKGRELDGVYILSFIEIGNFFFYVCFFIGFFFIIFMGFFFWNF